MKLVCFSALVGVVTNEPCVSGICTEAFHTRRLKAPFCCKEPVPNKNSPGPEPGLFYLRRSVIVNFFRVHDRGFARGRHFPVRVHARDFHGPRGDHCHYDYGNVRLHDSGCDNAHHGFHG